MESGVSTFFSIGIIALFVAAFVTFVGYYWFRSCDGFSNTNVMMQKILDKKEGFQGTGPTPKRLRPPKAMMPRQMNSDPTSKVAEKMPPGEVVSAEMMPTERPGNMPNSKGSMEGFAGPSVGAGEPNCMHVSSDAAALYDMLSKRTSTTEEGPDDLRELKQILSKISCFKKDLLGVAGVVEATRYQKFATAHDLEPVAETTARCFAKTIPQRDLSLSLDKWGSRGTFLLKRLCTSENLSDSEENDALRYFGDAMADITEIALGKCCNSDVGIIAGQPQPRMVGGFEPVENEILRPYDGYY